VAVFPLDYPISEHERRIDELFGGSGIPCPERGVASRSDSNSYSHFVICFVNRSGSNLLARALHSTGRFGLAGEFFNYPAVSHFARRHRIESLTDYAIELRRHSAATNGVFGTKLGWAQLYYLSKSRIIPNVYDQVKYVLIERRDVLGQAISYSIADQTKVWNSEQLGKGGRYRFDAADIVKRIRGITNAYARFKAFFALHDIHPMYLTYEELEGDIRAAVAKVVEGLAIPGTGGAKVDMGAVGLQRQRGPLNLQVRKAFLSHMDAG